MDVWKYKKFNKAVRLMGCINHVCRICTVKSLSRLTCMTNKFNMINAFFSSVGKRNRQSHILPYFVLPTWAYIERTVWFVDLFIRFEKRYTMFLQEILDIR